MNGIDAAAPTVELKDEARDILKLERAIAQAVSQSLLQVDNLQGSADEAFIALDGVVDRAKEALGTNESSIEVIDSYHSEIQRARDEAADLFERQRGVLGTVNIALFGRTGAGKSSLIEALVHGDGSTISTGESDFTTEVRGVTWRGCQVIDTPGTQGWGRSESRETLERRAGRAVEVADVVLLCFDSQGQQEGEFQKVSEWVREYGKPVIAVLNIRNAMWRRPDKVGLGTARNALSISVRQHATRITAELDRLGLLGVPIIALNAQRAAYARIDGNYLGPAAAQFHKLRDELGADALLHGSNLDILEAVIAGALTSHAAELRLGMLNSQVRTLMGRLVATLERAVRDAELRAGLLDKTIEKLFGIVGYPAMDSAARTALPGDGHGLDLLSCVERSRGEPYQAAACGRLVRFAQQRLDARLGLLRSEWLKRADEFVAKAFDDRKDVEPDAFVRAVFDGAKVEEAWKEILAELATLLRDEVKLTIDGAELDFRFAHAEGATIQGSAGQTRRWVGYGAGVAGVLSGVASSLAGYAMLDPELVSKVILGATALVTGLAALGLNSLSKKLRTSAAASRQAARGEANVSSRRFVEELYDGIEKQLAGAIDAIARDAMLRLLVQPLLGARGLRVLVSEGRVATGRLCDLGDGIPGRGDAQRVLLVAANQVAALHGGGSKIPARSVLLGEDWITDPIGLVAGRGQDERLRTKAYDPGRLSGLFDRFKGAFSQLIRTVLPGIGVRWLAEAERDCAQDGAAMAALDELRALQKRARPRLLLFGDYSSGKTSFVKRLLVDAGLPLPASLEVRADPTTDSVHVYEWEGFDLVDTPGLQGGVVGHDETAVAAYPDASVVIYLLPPNLLVGSTGALEQLLKGDRDRGLAAKLDCTIFVIHRSDEFGAAPGESPEEYLQLCERKKQELCGAFASRGVTIDTSRVFCMAADPYQLVGGRRDVNATQFDPYRTWDGFTEFHKAIREIGREFRGTGVDRVLLDGGLARFGELDAAAAMGGAAVEERKESFWRLGKDLEVVIAEGRRLEDQVRARIRGLVEDHMYTHLHRVSASETEVEFSTAAEQLKGWWESAEIQGDVDRWQHDGEKSIDDWRSNGLARINRTMASAHFRSAVAASRVQFESPGTVSMEYGWVGKTLNTVSKPLKGATRDVVYKLGKFIGVKFKPYGAINTAKGFAKAGVVLSAIAAGVDAVILAVDWKNESKRAACREGLQELVKQSADEIVKSLTEVGEESAGPIAYLRDGIEFFEEVAMENDSALADIEAETAAINDQRGRYRVCMERAWAAIDGAGLQA